MAALLEVKGLKAFYGQTQALYDIGFEIASGGITTLLGANGAGKTTTLRAICNMLRTEGTIRFDGQDIVGRATERDFVYFPRLKERLQQQAGTLSGGEQQMLAIARAVMLKPRLMLFDEPSFGLAPLIVVEIFRIMRRINEEEKVSMLLVEQNAALALDLADTAYVLETGRVVMSGPASVVKNDENIRKSYLGY